MSQFLRFSIVGGIGFLIDAGILQTLVSFFGTDPYWGRLFSFLAAVTGTWLLNRRITFLSGTARPLSLEWGYYVTLMTLGGGVNYATYAVCLITLEAARLYPVVGVVMGSLAGLAVNFVTAKHLVFKKRPGLHLV